MLRRILCIVSVILSLNYFALAHSHIYVGINVDGISNTGDENRLCIFGMPAIIEMLPTGDYLGGKQIYIGEIDCWHSAEHDTPYQLDDNSQQSNWQISLKRINYSDPVNFWMEDEATTLEILLSDSATYAFNEPGWDDDEGWHFHNHIEFLASADGAEQAFSATFTVFDTGLTGFIESSQYTLNFVTVPEPASFAIFGTGLFSILKLRRKQ
ncbi:MAG: hypothetical protein A2Y10_04100 [Planctomycetes bacterium GWF2_41_51]|nr:MAG: hypothetical protein A2Y10_04100 [Planctomycetes bacterium GWF2_41_51]HBG26493.1 hypothetical protein [Phycisphaerales bacterium]